MPVPRRAELNKRRMRQEKLAKLRKRYHAAKSEADKAKILQKVFKLAPWLSTEQFLLTSTSSGKQAEK